jgi:hypothetical protein
MGHSAILADAQKGVTHCVDERIHPGMIAGVVAGDSAPL